MIKSVFFRIMVMGMVTSVPFCLLGMENRVVEYAAVLRPFSLARAVTPKMIAKDKMINKWKQSQGIKNERYEVDDCGMLAIYNTDKFKFVRDQLRVNDNICWFDVFKYKNNIIKHLGRYYFAFEAIDNGMFRTTIKDRERIMNIFYSHEDFRNFSNLRIANNNATGL